MTDLGRLVWPTDTWAVVDPGIDAPSVRALWHRSAAAVLVCFATSIFHHAAWAELPAGGRDESAAVQGAEPDKDGPISGYADWILPEWDVRPAADASWGKRAGGKSLGVAYDFVNDTVTDTWLVTKSPLGWRWKEWAIVGAAAGATTGIIFLVDEEVRDASQGSEGFEAFGEGIRWIGTGGGVVALTGGFLVSGFALDREKDRDTARMLLEASAIGLGYGLAFKYSIGRHRPRSNRGARAFDPFGGAVSMPSGEALSAFIMAGVVTSQYPSWPVQILSYSTATAVGAGRIALDGHWSSDVFVSAVLGIAISKTVVKLNRIRRADRDARKRLELQGKAVQSLRKTKGRHSFNVTTRSFMWTYSW